MKLEKEIIKFKSIDRYYLDERNGLKPHTEREVDLTEEKHRLLVAMAVMKRYGCIEIHREVMPSKDKFKRKIKHITFWKNLVIISW